MRFLEFWPALAGLARTGVAAPSRSPPSALADPPHAQQLHPRALGRVDGLLTYDSNRNSNNGRGPRHEGSDSGQSSDFVSLAAKDGDGGDDRNIITATYATVFNTPEIKILDPRSRIKWTWGAAEMQQPELSATLQRCLSRAGTAVEAKVRVTGDDSKIIALFSQTAIVINYAPGTPDDKKVLWAACRPDLLPSAHTLELLPDNMLAVATTGSTMDDGIVVFDISSTSVEDPDASRIGPVQTIRRIPSVHSLVWDEHERLLWAAGNDKGADGRMGESYGLVNAYAYYSRDPDDNYNNNNNNKKNDGDDEDGGSTPGPPPLNPKPARSHMMPNAALVDAEWGHGSVDGQYWDGPHDVAPVPNERILLVSTDLDIHKLDLESGEFTCCEPVADEYLRGFEPTDERVGTDYDTGKPVPLPRSDMKSLAVTGPPENRSTLYAQARWKTYLDDYIRLLVDGVAKPPIDAGPGGVYAARWVDPIPGWPHANST